MYGENNLNQPRNLFLNSFWEKYPSADRVLSLFKIKNSPLKPVVARVLNKFDNFKIELMDQDDNIIIADFKNCNWILQNEFYSLITPYEVLSNGDWIAVDFEFNYCCLLSPNNNMNLTMQDNNYNFRNRKTQFRQWMKFKRTIQLFFLDKGFDEIETPTLVDCPGTEPFLEPFITHFINGKLNKKYYLPTSPELNLKKSLCRGWANIFEIKNCFRNGESTEIHNYEFHMLEWYRTFSNLEDIIDDIFSLLTYIQFPNWSKSKIIRLTLKDLFLTFCNFNLTPTTNGPELFALAKKLNLTISEKDKSWDFDDLFNFIYVEKIEPNLKIYEFLILEKYPPSQAALARLTEDGWGDRFEFYIAGLEIANAFNELNDPSIQRIRFQEDLEKKKLHNKTPIDLDDEFLTCLAQGMPPSSGIALGLERLFMMYSGIENIHFIKP